MGTFGEKNGKIGELLAQKSKNGEWDGIWGMGRAGTQMWVENGQKWAILGLKKAKNGQFGAQKGGKWQKKRAILGLGGPKMGNLGFGRDKNEEFGVQKGKNGEIGAQ